MKQLWESYLNLFVPFYNVEIMVEFLENQFGGGQSRFRGRNATGGLCLDDDEDKMVVPGIQI